MEPTTRPEAHAHSAAEVALNTTRTRAPHASKALATLPTDSSTIKEVNCKPAAQQRLQSSHVEVFPNSSSTSLSNLLCYGSDCGSDDDNLDIVDMYDESEDSVSYGLDLPSDNLPNTHQTKKDALTEGDVDGNHEDDDDEGLEDDDPTCEKSKKELEDTLKKMGELNITDLPPVCQSNAEVKAEECDLIGTVANTLGTLVMVESVPNKPAYDIDTLLFLDSGKRPLGYIFDVIGPVHNPLYAIRFNSVDEIKALNLSIGMNVYSAPATEHTRYVFVQQLLREKGSDASWRDDVEAPQDMQDSSGDEEAVGLPANRKRHSVERHSVERHQRFEDDMNLRNVIDSQMHNDRSQHGRSRHRQTHHHQPTSTRGGRKPQHAGGGRAGSRVYGRVDQRQASGASGATRGHHRAQGHQQQQPLPGYYSHPITATPPQHVYNQSSYNMGPCYVTPPPPIQTFVPVYMPPVFSTGMLRTSRSTTRPPAPMLFPPDMGLPSVQPRSPPYLPNMQYYNAPAVWANYAGQPPPPPPPQQQQPISAVPPPPPPPTTDAHSDAKSGDANFFNL